MPVTAIMTMLITAIPMADMTATISVIMAMASITSAMAAAGMITTGTQVTAFTSLIMAVAVTQCAIVIGGIGASSGTTGIAKIAGGIKMADAIEDAGEVATPTMPRRAR